MIRLIVETRVLLAVTVPPALPSFGCVLAGDGLLAVVSSSNPRRSGADRMGLFGNRPDKA